MKRILRKIRRKTVWPIQLYLIHHWDNVVLYALALALGIIIGLLMVKSYPCEPLISPVGVGVVQLPFVWEVTKPIKAENRYWIGLASYYSREGCIGCSENLHMANGQPLVDENLTVAFNKVKLGTKVKITNMKNNQSVVAVVTDRGGFERLGRIVDLTIGTKKAINCSDLCRVKVEEI